MGFFILGPKVLPHKIVSKTAVTLTLIWLGLSVNTSSQLERKSGGKFHPKLNRSSGPRAYKYHEGRYGLTSLHRSNDLKYLP